MTDTVNGANLAKCFEIVSAAGKEINALTETLDNVISEKLIEPSLVEIISAITPTERWDETGWVCTDFAHSFPIMKPRTGRKKPDMYFGYQISLSGDGIATLENPEPLLHVFLWAEPANFDEENYLWLPYHSDASWLRNGVLIDESGSTGEFPSDWTEQGWTFSLRLITLNTREDLEKQVVEPALALLRGESPDVALPSDLPGLVHYRITEDGDLAIAG